MRKTIIFLACLFSVLWILEVASAPPVNDEDGIHPEVRKVIERQTEADKELSAICRKLMSVLPKDKQAQLRKAQRAWIAFRDEQAELEANGAGWGFPASLHESLTRLTEARTQELRGVLSYYWTQDNNAEPDGAANGSQPIRSETNRTSLAAGSRR
jgi:uncharacterized protein YecT (DUF1311 family)